MFRSQHDIETLGVSRRVNLDVSFLEFGVLLELLTKVGHLVSFSVDEDLYKTKKIISEQIGGSGREGERRRRDERREQLQSVR